MSTEGENATLVCYITSSKLPMVFWFKVNTTVTNGPGQYGKRLWMGRPRKESKDQENDLFVSRYHLSNVTVRDSGLYRCLAMVYVVSRRIMAHDNGTLMVVPKGGEHF